MCGGGGGGGGGGGDSEGIKKGLKFHVIPRGMLNSNTLILLQVSQYSYHFSPSFIQCKLFDLRVQTILLFVLSYTSDTTPYTLSQTS